MRILVQKFGGTSLATQENRQKAIKKIVEAKKKGFHPLVVVSAIGRAPEPYATDALLSIIKECRDCIDKRELDMLMSCGELISSVLIAGLLKKKRYHARALSGLQAGIFTDEHYGDAAIIHVNTEYVKRLLGEGIIPVIAGFQGATKNYDITTLGRGGSDTTAAAMAAALKAESLEIYTDVDGIKTFDPRIMAGSKVIPELTYEEVAEMAYEGAKVLHGRCVSLAWEYKVPLWVKNTFSNKQGSFISDKMPGDAFEKLRLVTSLANISNVALVSLDFSEIKNISALRLIAFKTLAEKGISLDLINICGDKLHFIVKENQLKAVHRIARDLKIPCRTKKGCAKLSVIGAGMRGTPGVMAKIQEALQSAGVKVLHSTDSHITISCLILKKDLKKAVSVLTEKFNIQ